MANDSDQTPKPKGRSRKKPVAGKSRTPLKPDSSDWRKRFRDPSKTKFNDEAKKLFVEAVEKTGRITAAIEVCQISARTYYNHREKDAVFAESVDHAVERYRAVIAAEVYRRGKVGWDEPVFSGGKRVLDFVLDDKGQPIFEPVRNSKGEVLKDDDGKPIIQPLMIPATVRKFSDRLLELEAKRSDPAYKDKPSQFNVGIAGGSGLQMEGAAPNKITIEFVKPGGDEAISLDNVVEGIAKLIEDGTDS